ncbi:hypothetical protein AZ54_09070 [Xanthomonas oryzae pv. oryzae PXO86]|nr:hypothetical protein AZ54_09070 [Xanthomonas oryzae pv. oryzae PXO86]
MSALMCVVTQGALLSETLHSLFEGTVWRVPHREM